MSRRLSRSAWPAAPDSPDSPFPSPSGFCHRLCHRLDRPTCRCRRQRLIRHGLGASDSRPTLLPAVLSSHLASSHSLPFSLCSPLPPGNHPGKAGLFDDHLPLPPIRPPPRPTCAIRKAHFALPCGCRLALLSPSLPLPLSHSQYISAAPPERTIPREQNKQPVLCERRTGLAPVPPCLPSEPDEAIGLLQSTARFTTSLPFFYHGDRRPSTLCAPRRGTLADLDQPQEQAKL